MLTTFRRPTRQAADGRLRYITIDRLVTPDIYTVYTGSFSYLTRVQRLFMTFVKIKISLCRRT
jgi:hypothetical protein